MYLTVDKLLNVTFNKIMIYVLIHFWGLKYFYLFSAAILDFGSHLNLFMVIRVQNISLTVFFT